MPRGTFVGRERELAIVGDLARQAGSGAGGVVLVDGEPGIGKTAFGDEMARRLQRAGFVTAWGTCAEDQCNAPFRPWLPVLRRLGLPEELVLPPAGETGSQHFGEVVAEIRKSSAGQPLFIVLDDLQWADGTSLSLLRAIASEAADCRLLVLGMFSAAPAEPARSIEVVSRERATSRLTLGGLAVADMAALAAAVWDGQPPAATLRSITERAEGNPLFALELARFAAAGTASDATVPDSVRKVFGHRFARLPASTREMLQRAAVLGREFSVSRLGVVLRQPADTIVDGLEPAVVSELMIRVGVDRIRFAHALGHEVAYGELPGAEQQRLHLRVADAIRGRTAPGGVNTLAHHLRVATPLSPAREALDATLAAARRADQQLAHEQAVALYSGALELPPVADPPTSRQRLVLDLAHSQFRAGAVTDAWASCLASADLSRAHRDVATLAKAALVIRGVTDDPISDQLHALCQEALALLETESAGDRGAEVLRARLLGQLAVTRNRWASQLDGNRGELALAAAEDCGDADAVFLALQAHHADPQDIRDTAARLALGERAVHLGHQVACQHYSAWGHVWRMDAYWTLGDRAGIQAELTSFGRIVDHLREPLGRWRLTMIQASGAMLDGRFDDAGRLADEALAIGRRGGHREPELTHLVFRSHHAAQRGDTGTLGELEPTIRELTRSGPFPAVAWHARVLADLNRLDEARRLMGIVGAQLPSFPRRTAEWFVAAATSAELSVRLDLPALRNLLYAALLPLAGRHVAPRAQSPSLGPVSLHLGMLARAQREWTAAGEHLRQALDEAIATDSPPFEAMARVELAQLCVARHGNGDLRKAGEQARKALEIAEKYGMRPVDERARSLVGKHPGGLSDREWEIAGLIADDDSNRVIAERLRIGNRTVETHVRSILNKIGRGSRAGIASWYISQRHEGA